MMQQARVDILCRNDDDRHSQQRSQHQKPLEKVCPTDRLEPTEEGIADDDQCAEEHARLFGNTREDHCKHRGARHERRCHIHGEADQEDDRADDLQRLGFSQKLFIESKQTACIDHHVSNEAFADVNYIVPDASSTSELVYNLLDYDKMSLETAEALYMGIAHDTGIFRYSCTSPETMEAAAQLMRKGVDTAKITDRTYYEKTYVQNQILGRALLESIMVLDQRCIVSVVRLKEMEFFQAKPSDLDGIVSVLRQTRGVEVAILLYELEPQTFKVSLRSKEIVDVSAVAKYYGGGGHVRAAGVTMKGSPHDVINNLTLLIERQLRAAEEKNEKK